MSDLFHELEETVTTDVRRALAEDVGAGDLTAALLPAGKVAKARLITRQDAVLCGTEWFERTVELLDPEAEIYWHHKDGDDIVAGSNVCEVEGDTRALLTAERTAINFLQTLSAVATRTRAYVKRVEGTKATILDTRKTTPGLRALQKYAVRAGGGTNKRMGLYDVAMIKDNHKLAAGSITAAFDRIRERFPDVPIQVEVTTADEAREAIAAGARFIMCDNMSPETLRATVEAIEAAGEEVEVEATGGLTLERAGEYAATGVDYLSVGALTHSAAILDIALDLV